MVVCIPPGIARAETRWLLILIIITEYCIITIWSRKIAKIHLHIKWTTSTYLSCSNCRCFTVGFSEGYPEESGYESRDSPRSERDGARNTRIQTCSGRRSVIPYVLCDGLYSLWYCSMFWRGPCSTLYNLGEQGYMEILVESCWDSSPRRSASSRGCGLVLLLFG